MLPFLPVSRKFNLHSFWGGAGRTFHRLQSPINTVQRGRPAMPVTRLTSGLPEAADLTIWERRHAAVEVDRLMEGGSDLLQATDGCDWWPPVHLERRRTHLIERSPTPTPHISPQVFISNHRPPAEQPDMTTHTEKSIFITLFSPYTKKPTWYNNF